MEEKEFDPMEQRVVPCVYGEKLVSPKEHAQREWEDQLRVSVGLKLPYSQLREVSGRAGVYGALNLFLWERLGLLACLLVLSATMLGSEIDEGAGWVVGVDVRAHACVPSHLQCRRGKWHPGSKKKEDWNIAAQVFGPYLPRRCGPHECSLRCKWLLHEGFQCYSMHGRECASLEKEGWWGRAAQPISFITHVAWTPSAQHNHTTTTTKSTPHHSLFIHVFESLFL